MIKEGVKKDIGYNKYHLAVWSLPAIIGMGFMSSQWELSILSLSISLLSQDCYYSSNVKVIPQIQESFFFRYRWILRIITIITTITAIIFLSDLSDEILHQGFAFTITLFMFGIFGFDLFIRLSREADRNGDASSGTKNFFIAFACISFAGFLALGLSP